jgi:probable HAF family extracellular repeat protein
MDGPDEVHAFVWDAATGARFIEPEGAASSYATDINNQGAIAFHVDAQATIREPSGEMAPLGSLGGGVDLSALNDQGDAVGFAGTNDPPVIHAFLWTDGVMRDLNIESQVPGGHTEFECAYDLNNAGVAVGAALAYQIDGDSLNYGFVATLNSVQIFPNVTLLSINDRGQAVGSIVIRGSDSSPDVYTAALCENAAVVDLNTRMSSDFQFNLVDALRINNRGQILAGGLLKSDGSACSDFVLTPVPEPSSGIAAIAAACLIVVVHRHPTHLAAYRPV